IQYRKLLLQNRIKEFDKSQETEKDMSKQKTKILPNMNNNIDMDLYDEKNVRRINKIRNLIDQLAIIYENPITAKEYLEYEKEEATHQMMTNKEIVRIINEPKDNLNTDKTVKMPIITYHETSEALKKVINYVEQRGNKIEFQ
ncbi:8635_t:CDS:2, partial [Racocetra persica]